MKTKLITSPIIVLFIIFSFGSASAQSTEIGLLLGGLKTSDKSFQLPSSGELEIGTGLTFQLNYAQRLADLGVASLYFEVPFLATPSTSVTSSNFLVPRNYATIFITPGLKLKLLPGSRVSPFGAVGVGYARLTASTSLTNGQPNTAGDLAANHGAFDFGGGVDIGVIRFIALRGEVRDFLTGKPNLNVHFRERQHNVVASGGIVLRF
jgi:opacity protein-like surface antigen